jgi:hypothetical protein
MRALLAFIALISSSPAFACSAPYAELFVPDWKIVSKAEGVVLARVVGFEPAVHKPRSERRDAIFHFQTTETLKGQAPQQFDLSGYSALERKDVPGDFDGHRMPKFWADNSSNSVSPGDCESYGIFAVGETYLIFLMKGTHRRGYENIRSEDDLWLQVVRLLVVNDSFRGKGA